MRSSAILYVSFDFFYIEISNINLLILEFVLLYSWHITL